MKGYTDQQVQTTLLEAGIKPLFSTDCEVRSTGSCRCAQTDIGQPGVHYITLDQQTPLASPIDVTLGVAASGLRSHNFSSPHPGSWADLVARQVNLGDPTPSRVMDHKKQSSINGGGEYPTWDELVKQGAMLGEDGTDTLAMQKKEPLYH